MPGNSKARIGVQVVTRGAMQSALLLISQVALSSIPNTELVSFLTIMFTLMWGAQTLVVVEVFALLEIAIYGVGLWNIMYLYIWPILVLLTLLMRKNMTRWKAVLLSGLFGLAFGGLCTIVYLVFSPQTALAWWTAGIPFDLWHGFCNAVIMWVLYNPVLAVLKRIKNVEQ